jgi:hypothetical protein
MARAIKQPISACPAMNALRGKRIVAPARAQRMPISMGPTRKDAGTASRSSTRARASEAQIATAHWRVGRIDPKVHLLPSRSSRTRVRSACQSQHRFLPPLGPTILDHHLWPSVYPASLKPWRNAATLRAKGAGDPPLTNPTTGMAPCCARATKGQTAAPPSAVMTSRRLMRSIRRHGP